MFVRACLLGPITLLGVFLHFEYGHPDVVLVLLESVSVLILKFFVLKC